MCLAFAGITFASAAVSWATCASKVVAIRGENIAVCDLQSSTETTCTYHCNCSGSCTEALKGVF